MTFADDTIQCAWVMLAALLALVEDECGSDRVAQATMAHKLMSARGRARTRAMQKLDAYVRDPDNREKINACCHQAAEMLGIGQTRQ